MRIYVAEKIKEIVKMQQIKKTIYSNSHFKITITDTLGLSIGDNYKSNILFFLYFKCFVVIVPFNNNTDIYIFDSIAITQKLLN